MKRSRQFTGSYTALVTPFQRDAVAYGELRKLVEAQIKGGIDGLVPVGTTGESPTVTHEEHLEIIRVTIEAARGRVPVIAGTGSKSTEEAIHLTAGAAAAGADGFLLVAPYYNRPFFTDYLCKSLPVNILHNKEGKTDSGKTAIKEANNSRMADLAKE